jgi:hypothetical protein
VVYIFDTNSFRVLGNYFPRQFPSFWQRFNECVAAGEILSVREVYNELQHVVNRQHLLDWTRTNKKAFVVPNDEETRFLGEIFAIAHFRQLVGKQQLLQGTPVADPFIIACGKVRNACVVTEEVLKKNAAKIPNVCDHFSVEYTNVEGFLAREGWTF